MIAEDIVEHFERRIEAMAGKGMIVCMSRRICVGLYNAIVRLRPEWHSDDDAMEGRAVWLRIVKAIEELLSEEMPEDAEVHSREFGGQ